MKSWVLRWTSVFRLFSLRGWLITAAGGIATLVIIGIPSAIIDNPFFVRQTPVRPQDLVIGTFAVSRKAKAGGRAASGGVLSFLAVGCPICNKLIVLLLGVSGALTYFAPLQIYIGVASLGLLVWALHLRMQAIYGSCCAVPQSVDISYGSKDG
ncbi:MAG: hypothetical protein HY645_07255 [Acidobacteria bacterium]|nr:hypothetical protein [Acidobacteriota bacterium]